MRGASIISALVGAGVALGLVAVLWFGVFMPLQHWRSSAIAEQSASLIRIETLKSRIHSMKRAQSQLSDKGTLDVIWEAEQSGTATAMIQSRLSELATKRGVSLRSITPLRDRDLSLARAAGFRIELEAALDQLTVFLRDIEYHTPALLIDKASLRHLNKVNNKQSQPLVFAQIEISAPIALAKEVTE